MELASNAAKDKPTIRREVSSLETAPYWCAMSEDSETFSIEFGMGSLIDWGAVPHPDMLFLISCALGSECATQALLSIVAEAIRCCLDALSVHVFSACVSLL